ncbi:hypothetical protein GVAV_002397 [Gurleya vavrai]
MFFLILIQYLSASYVIKLAHDDKYLGQLNGSSRLTVYTDPNYADRFRFILIGFDGEFKIEKSGETNNFVTNANGFASIKNSGDEEKYASNNLLPTLDTAQIFTKKNVENHANEYIFYNKNNCLTHNGLSINFEVCQEDFANQKFVLMKSTDVDPKPKDHPKKDDNAKLFHPDSKPHAPSIHPNNDSKKENISDDKSHDETHTNQKRLEADNTLNEKLPALLNEELLKKVPKIDDVATKPTLDKLTDQEKAILNEELKTDLLLKDLEKEKDKLPLQDLSLQKSEAMLNQKNILQHPSDKTEDSIKLDDIQSPVIKDEKTNLINDLQSPTMKDEEIKKLNQIHSPLFKDEEIKKPIDTIPNDEIPVLISKMLKKCKNNICDYVHNVGYNFIDYINKRIKRNEKIEVELSEILVCTNTPKEKVDKHNAIPDSRYKDLEKGIVYNEDLDKLPTIHINSNKTTQNDNNDNPSLKSFQNELNNQKNDILQPKEDEKIKNLEIIDKIDNLGSGSTIAKDENQNLYLVSEMPKAN